MESPEFDLCRFLTRLIWLVLLLTSPILAVYGLLVFAGALPAVLACVGVFFLFRILSPLNLWSTLQTVIILNPFRQRPENQIPVRYFRVRATDDGREVMARLKGVYTKGNFAADDLVSLWGRWRDGVLHVSRGHNHRTQSGIALSQSHSWIGLTLTLVFLLLLAGMFYQPTLQLKRNLSPVFAERTR